MSALFTRTGVFSYTRADGTTRKEYRPDTEVFDQASLDTFQHTTITNDHPDEPITIQNAKGLTVGIMSGEAKRFDDHVGGDLIIFDKDTIDQILSGKQELSCGYIADVEHVEGVTPDGERYDAIQRNIRINHIAIVQYGRAGRKSRIKLDAVQTKETSMELQEALKRIAQLEVDKAQESKRADNAEQSLQSEKDRADKAEAKADAAAEAKADAELKADSLEKGLADKIRQRVSLESTAGQFVKDCSDKTDRQIKEAVIESITGTKMDSDKPDTYIDARYDAALERHEASNDDMKKVGENLSEAKEDAGDSLEAKRAAMVKRNAGEK